MPRQMIAVERRRRMGRDHAAAVVRCVELGEAVVAQRQRAAHGVRPPSAPTRYCVRQVSLLRQVSFLREASRWPPAGFGVNGHAGFIVLEPVHGPAEADIDVRTAARTLEQELLDVQLVGAQTARHLICRGRRRHGALLFGLGGHAKPRQLVAVQPGEVAHVVGRSAAGRRADLLGYSEPAMMLHGARVVRRAFGMPDAPPARR